MIRLLWVKSNKPLSKVIRWTFKEPCSHFAIAFDDRFIFHSDLRGAYPTFWSWFMQSHEVVHELIFKAPIEIEDSVWDQIVKRFDKPKPYDWGAFCFFTITGLSHRLFNTAMPKRNLWGDKDSFLCVELADICRNLIQVPDNLDICTPENLWLTAKPNKYCVNAVNGGTTDETNRST